MRRYEQIYILRPSLSEEQIATSIENTSQIIVRDGGTIISTNRWGMKKLAYPIKKELQGYYVFCDFAATPAAVAEAERKFRIDDAVLKYLTVKLADTISAEEIAAAQEAAAAASTADESESDSGQSEEEEEATDKQEAVKETADENK